MEKALRYLRCIFLWLAVLALALLGIIVAMSDMKDISPRIGGLIISTISALLTGVIMSIILTAVIRFQYGKSNVRQALKELEEESFDEQYRKILPR